MRVRFCGRYLGLVRSDGVLEALRAYLPAISACSRRKLTGGDCRGGKGVPWYGAGRCLIHVPFSWPHRRPGSEPAQGSTTARTTQNPSPLHVASPQFLSHSNAQLPANAS